MIKTNEALTFSEDHIVHSLPKILGCSNQDILFIDIETTGLSLRSSDLYLIGLSFYKDGKWQITQFFAEDINQEKEILEAFLDFSKGFTKILHYNGDRFDLPYIKIKLEKYNLPDAFESMDSIDIYKKIGPYKRQLGLMDCKQKTIELYLGINREDKYDGGKLIPIYKNYEQSKNPEALKLLLLHNFEDVKGMFGILPMLQYSTFFAMFKNLPKVSVRTDDDIDDEKYCSDWVSKLPVKAVKVQANQYDDMDGNSRKEIFMKLSMAMALPCALTGNYEGFYLKTNGSEATLRLPLYEDELKYFYSNYKDYFYLPKEDMAIHKSIASFVDKAYREKAKPETCYTKKEGQFLKEWDLVFAPFFKKDYEDKNFYFDLNENMKKSRFAMSLYASHVMAKILEI
ncbi:hypothetical protein D6853_00130 [Butyrivibrio sp. X503]|uniref:ribonuclease H-like domain-containing protein n=1 Tax=Butyrivibrio sp. X503 TaxID=2364878 RepID=UPI000EA9C5DB|nr:ribonuclease H-like domain-containing protein [Butyrivibrio sp. X503]RKM57985.1 hypothetical protein D6853_00130 [Butyrivibrio sp. X503]